MTEKATICWDVLQNGEMVDIFWASEEMTEKEVREAIIENGSYPEEFELRKKEVKL